MRVISSPLPEVMRCCTFEFTKDLLWIRDVLIEYPLHLLMVEVMFHSLLAIVTKQHQFDVMEVSIQLSSAGPRGLTSQLIVVELE